MFDRQPASEPWEREYSLTIDAYDGDGFPFGCVIAILWCLNNVVGRIEVICEEMLREGERRMLHGKLYLLVV